MNKAEFQEKLLQGMTLIEKKNYSGAVNVLDELNLDSVRDPRVLQNIAKAYEKCHRYEDAEDLLLQARDYAPRSRGTLFHLCTLAIRMGDLSAAVRYYNEFCQIAKYDSERFILQYRIAQAEGRDDKELISILENFKGEEPDDRWMFELARLYAQNGRANEALEVCDEISLWFYNGKYVQLARALRADLTGEAALVQDEPEDGDAASEEESNTFNDWADSMTEEAEEEKAEEKPEEAPEEEPEEEEQPEESRDSVKEELPEDHFEFEAEDENLENADLDDTFDEDADMKIFGSRPKERPKAASHSELDSQMSFIPDMSVFQNDEEDERTRRDIFEANDELEIREYDEEEKLPEGDEIVRDTVKESFPEPKWDSLMASAQSDFIQEDEEDEAPENPSEEESEEMPVVLPEEESVEEPAAPAEEEADVLPEEKALAESLEETEEEAETAAPKEEPETEAAEAEGEDQAEAETEEPAEEKPEEKMTIREAYEKARTEEENAFEEALDMDFGSAVVPLPKDQPAAPYDEASKDGWRHIDAEEEDEHIIFNVTGPVRRPLPRPEEKPEEERPAVEIDDAPAAKEETFIETAAAEMPAESPASEEPLRRPSEEDYELEDLEAELNAREADSAKLGNLPIEPEYDSRIWHFIVYGDNKEENLERARELMKELQGRFQSAPKRMLKASAERFENANIVQSFDFFLGNMVIIEDAGALSDSQLRDFSRVLEKDDLSCLIALTDTREHFEKMFLRVPEIANSFTAAFEGKPVMARDLVNTAKEYLLHQGARMDREAQSICYEYARKLLKEGQGFYRSRIRDYAKKALDLASKGGIRGLFSGAEEDDGLTRITARFFIKAGES